MALLAVCGAAWAGMPAGGTPQMDAYLRQTQALGISDHAQFVQRLAELNAQAASLSPAQQWRLRYANAWEAMFVGDYGRSEPLFRDIIAHSGEPDLAGRASALLMSQFGIVRRYSDAFEMANRIVAELPRVTDPGTRRTMLLNLAQTLGLAGQSRLAIRYARMAVDLGGSDRSRCFAIVALIDALDSDHQLQVDSPVLQRGLAACPAATQPVYHAELQLLMAKLETSRGHPHQALAVLDGVAPLVNAADYAPHQLSLAVHRAQALFALGDGASAMALAQSVLTRAKPGDFDNWLRDAYELAYKIAKQRGDTATALSDYEKFAALDKRYLDDVNARAVSTSAGLAFTDTQGYQLQALFREADMALYKAKRGGRNRLFIEAVDTGLSGL